MEPTRHVVPYVPFRTFLTALEGLERALPNQLDRSVWPSYSGAIQGQLLGALRFLGLMDENNGPTAELREAVLKPDLRKAVLRRILERNYAPLIALDLSRTSPHQLDEAMRQYGLSGATHKKAVSFFLQAVQYSGLPLSALLRGKVRGAARPAHRTPAPEPALSKSIQLRSGGTVTLTAAVDLFSLAAEDRSFLFELIDQLQGYERGAG